MTPLFVIGGVISGGGGVAVASMLLGDGLPEVVAVVSLLTKLVVLPGVVVWTVILGSKGIPDELENACDPT